MVTKSISEKYSRSIIRMVGVILLVVSLAGIVANGIWIHSSAEARLDRAARLVEVSLPYSMWNFDEQAISEVLDALMLDPEVRLIDVAMEGMGLKRVRPGAKSQTVDAFRDSLFYSIRDQKVTYEGETIGTVHIVQSRSSLVTEILISVVAALAVTGLLLVLITMRSIRLTERFIFGPIQQLESAASTIAHGDLEREIDTRGDDEIGSLARSLDAMRHSIQRLVGDLQSANRELEDQNKILEAKVRERTRELREANKLLSSENLRLGAELDVSRQLQKMLLPRDEELRSIESLDIGAFMEPATEVGGDYFDVLRSGDNVRIGIGDVTGHGLESGVVMLLTQSAVRTLTSTEERDLARMVDVLNKTMVGNISRMGSEKNLTFSLIDYHPVHGGNGVAGRLRIVGQHESVLVFRADGSIDEIDTLMLGMPIGLIDEVGEFLGEEVIDLHVGDVVVLYTDGITEAANPDHDLFGVERLKEVAGANRHHSAEAIKEAIIERVREHIGEQTLFDDLTLLVLKQQPQATAEAPRAIQ